MSAPRLPGAASAFRIGFALTFGGLVAVFLVQLLTSLQPILVVVALALFGALGLQRPIEWLMAHRWPRWAAATLVTLTMLAGVAVTLAALIPLLIDQVALFAQSFPSYVEMLRGNPQVAALDAQFGLLDRALAYISSPDWITSALGGFLGASLAAAGVFTGAVLTTVLLLFFTWSAPAIRGAIDQLAPASKRPRVRYLVDAIVGQIGDYLAAMTLVVALWSTLAFIVTNVVGIGRFSLALALLTGLSVLIPAVGSFFATAVVALVALSVSPGAALAVVIAFLGYQQLDAYVVQPRLFARSLQVPPVLVILGVAAGMTLFGVLGAVLAIPVVASLLLLYREILVPQLDAA